METKRQQGFIIPIVVIFVCLFAFGIPYLVAGGQDTHSDIVLQPHQSPTPTPLDRALTQQAFADLFFTPTNFPIFRLDSQSPSPTLPEVGILVSGSTITPVTVSPTPTKTLLPIFVVLTRISGGGLFGNPTSTLTSTPLPTHTNVPTATKSATPLPTNTPAPTDTFTPEPTDTHKPTNTVEPTDTPVPPTDTPEPPPTDTPEPPPTDTPEPPPGGNGTNTNNFGLNLIWILPFAILLPRFLFKF